MKHEIQKFLQTQCKQNLNFNKTEFAPLTKGITYLGTVCKQVFNAQQPLQL